MIDRALAPQISADLEDKMVLLSGPRQSGKTTLARAVLARASRATAERYLNWLATVFLAQDRKRDRKVIAGEPLVADRLQAVQMIRHQPEQRRCLGTSWCVEAAGVYGREPRRRFNGSRVRRLCA